MTEQMRYSRRELIEMALGSSAVATLLAAGVGCEYLDSMTTGRLPPRGKLLSPNRELGHRLRDGANVGDQSRRAEPSGNLGNQPRRAEPSGNLGNQPRRAEPSGYLGNQSRRVEPSGYLGNQSRRAEPSDYHGGVEKRACVIVGAGVAGLSAAWHLNAAGLDDFVVLELESTPGGTSRSGATDGFQYPWGAHYLPVPLPENRPLVEFLQQCGVLESTADGSVVAAEQVLCRDPEERVFAAGQWQPGLYPESIASPEDLKQLERFRSEMVRLANRRGEDGRRWFAIPLSKSSVDPLARRLDQVSMSDWMDEQGFDSAPLGWLVDYACRDDYGLRTEQTSAWAGLFYFAARIADASGESQPVMTWPQGNGFLVDQLVQPLGDRLRLGKAVMRIAPLDSQVESGPMLLDVFDCKTQTTSRIQAERIIVAVPQFIASRMIDAKWRETYRRNDPLVTSYGSWLVANVHLSERPDEPGFPMAWDNVAMASTSLGYVNSGHQTGRDHGATVLTWYQALASDAPALVREKLMQLSWAEAAEAVILDLEIAHPKIRGLITQLDVMVWGHAMPEPRVGSIFHPSRIAAKEPLGNMHFACTDLSAMALFEEAFDHGHRAAAEVLSR